MARSYAISQVNNLIEICAPLFHNSPIKHFMYGRQYYSGEYFVVSNTKNYLHKEWPDNGEIFQTELRKSTHDAFHYFLWPNPDSKVNNDTVMKALLSVNLSHGITLYRRTNNFVECWDFAGSLDDLHIQNFVINNNQYIQMFMAYFQEKASDITDCSDVEKLGMYHNPIVVKPIQDSQILQLLKTKRAKEGFKVRCKNGITHLTSQQLICLEHLNSGKIVKEIAKDMQLSPRTVENYLSTIRNKTGYSARSDLVKLYQDHLNVFF